MLFIQNLTYTWHKQERSAACAALRRRFPQAYLVEETTILEEAALHILSFTQKGTALLDSRQVFCQSMEQYLPKLGYTAEQVQREIERRSAHIQTYHLQTYASIQNLRLLNLVLHPCPQGCRASFFYDEHQSGKPYRRGHNKDYNNPDSPLYRQDCLNETAFTLAPGQYGRILWNERRTDYDTGEWYYQLHIYNLVNVPGHQVKSSLLTSRSPDFIYRQKALL